jgi:OmpA-OmpF porin, OOP family
MVLRSIPFLTLFTFTSLICFGQGESYNDGHGGKVLLPLGDRSFADEVVSFTKGDPEAVHMSSIPADAKGKPDFDGENKGFVSLGCGGTLILKFTDNALINIDGPDLFVFEMGKYIESTDLAISKDGINWISIGTINGAKAEVDIEQYTKEGEVFTYVRLTDLKTECSGMWPGADIDAVAAIGSVKRFSLTASILFDFNKAVLKPQASKSLNKLSEEIKKYPGTKIIVEGYTDSLGTEGYNKKLSLSRAIAVKKYLERKLPAGFSKIEAKGMGENNPLVSNNTKEGQEKNRRVEILVFPFKK